MTLKQQLVANKLSENIGKPLGQIMLEAGYSQSTSKTPARLTKSKSWPELLEKGLPDKKLLKRHNELLDKKETIAIGKPGEREVLTTDQPDSSAVARGLDMAYKLKNKYPVDRDSGNTNIAIVNVIRFDKEQKDKIEAKLTENEIT